MVRPYPVHTLEETAAISTTIQEANAGLPFDRVLLAKALGTTPASSGYTMKLNSSAKYGLTQGGYNDDRITLTARGQSVVAPQAGAERHQALVDAALQPEVFRRFYQLLDGKRVPEDSYAENMLQRELGVHAGLAAECLRILKANGLYVGLLGEVGGSLYVSLSGAHAPERIPEAPERPEPARAPDARQEPQRPAGKIYIGHAAAPDVVDFIKTVLDEFDIPFAVVESDYDSHRPVSAEASHEMRSCDAAILVFATPSWARVSGGREVSTTEIMLYQLGAASVLYGDRVISLTEEGMEPGGQDASLHTLHFNRDQLGDVALLLLAELHRIEVIQVSVAAGPAATPAPN
jgi:hypothetical protein